MSSTTEVHLTNIALAAVGEPKITALSDSNARAVAANVLYEPTRDALLEDFLWNFAVRRAKLTIPESAYLRITGATSANPVVITSASHGLSDGDSVRIINVVGMTEINGRVFEIQNKATNTFELKDEDGRNHTDYLSSITISTTDNLDPVEVTASAAHGLTTGDVVNITGVSTMTEINDRRFTITVTSTTVFTLDDENGTGYTAGTGGTVTTGSSRKVPAFGPTNEFALPTNFFRIARTKEATDRWRIENGTIVSDDETVSMVYVVKVTDDAGVATMSEGFKQSLSARLAWKLSFALTGRQSLSASLKKDYADTLSKAVFTDTQQESITTVGGSTYVNSRLHDPRVGAEGGWADSV